MPELRREWWEASVAARAETTAFALLAGLPSLVGQAVVISWRADRLRTTIIAVTALISGVLSTFGLLATQQVLVAVFAGGPTPDRVRTALPALAALAAATALRAVLTVVTGYTQNTLSPRVNHTAEHDLFGATSAVRLEAFDEDAFADDMERATRNTDAVVDLVGATVDLLAGLIGILAVAAAVALIHPLLLLALLLSMVPRLWAALRAGRIRYLSIVAGSVRRRRLRMLQDLMAHRTSAPELRGYRLRDFLLDQHDRVMDAETRVQLGLARRVGLTQTIGAATGGIATTAVYVLLGVLLLHGHIPLAAAATCVIALQAAQRTLTSTVYQIDRVYTDGQEFRDYRVFMQRAADLMPSTPGSTQPLEALAELTVDGVSLHYPGRSTPALSDVTLTIHAGETVAFVGENGSGKSTLAALIAGQRSTTNGHIRWNGSPLPAHQPDLLAPRIAVVSQNFHTWPFAAGTNIGLGDITAPIDQTRLQDAATRAAAHEMIEELPHGYETLLDRTFAGGQDLSGGQWQRITAARGFYSSTDLLIMDEPSSALDPRAENTLFQAIRDRQGSTTTILITHRLANVRHADRIFVLDRGRLIENGTHEQLMAEEGLYFELFQLQATGYTGSDEVSH